MLRKIRGTAGLGHIKIFAQRTSCRNQESLVDIIDFIYIYIYESDWKPIPLLWSSWVTFVQGTVPVVLTAAGKTPEAQVYATALVEAGMFPADIAQLQANLAE